MSAIVDNEFYYNVYMGSEADDASFPALCARAEDVVGALARWQVTEDNIGSYPELVQTLYKKAYTIKSGTDVTRIPDQTEGSADGKVIYGLQDDHSFGKTNYCIKYRETENEVAATFTNFTPLHVGPIKAVESEDLVIDIVITDCGDDFIVYLTVRAKFLAVSVLEPIMNDSLSSRLNAIYSWFVNQF